MKKIDADSIMIIILSLLLSKVILNAVHHTHQDMFIAILIEVAYFIFIMKEKLTN